MTVSPTLTAENWLDEHSALRGEWPDDPSLPVEPALSSRAQALLAFARRLADEASGTRGSRARRIGRFWATILDAAAQRVSAARSVAAARRRRDARQHAFREAENDDALSYPIEPTVGDLEQADAINTLLHELTTQVRFFSARFDEATQGSSADVNALVAKLREQPETLRFLLIDACVRASAPGAFSSETGTHLVVWAPDVKHRNRGQWLMIDERSGVHEVFNFTSSQTIGGLNRHDLHQRLTHVQQMIAAQLHGTS